MQEPLREDVVEAFHRQALKYRKRDRWLNIGLTLLTLFFLLQVLHLSTGCTRAASPESVCTPQFWRALELAESGGNPNTMYREDGINDHDRITGLSKVFSEGPYQLSYSDVLNYGAACDFAFDIERQAFLDDVKAHMVGDKTFYAKNAFRQILQREAQQRCAEEIVRTLGTRNLGKYWSSIRDGKVKVDCQ